MNPTPFVIKLGSAFWFLVRGTDGYLWRHIFGQTYAGAPHWVRLGRMDPPGSAAPGLTSAPTATVSSSTSLMVAARGSDGATWVSIITASTGTDEALWESVGGAS